MSSRKIDDVTLTLSASGWTYKTRFVLYDYQTESLWFPVSGISGLTCIGGFYADRLLNNLQSEKTGWKKWKAKHPQTKFMKY